MPLTQALKAGTGLLPENPGSTVSTTGSLQLPLTLFAEDMTPSPGLQGYLSGTHGTVR